MKQEEKQKYKSNIWKSHVFRFLRNFHFMGGVLIPFFTIWGGISFFQIMILQAVFTASVFLLEIPTGAIADKFGRKTSLILASFVTAIAALIYGSYPNFWIFMLAEFVWAIGTTLVSGADQALIYDSLKEIKKEKQSKRIFGRWNSLGLISLGIAAPIGSLIAKYLGLRYVFILMAIPLALGGIIALTFKEPEIGRKEEKKEYIKTLKGGIKYFKGHKILKIMAIDYISISVLVFFIIWVYQVILQNLNVPIVYFGFIHAGITLAQVLVLNSFIFLEKIFKGKKNYLLFSALIAGIGFILIAFSKNAYLSITGIILIAGFGLTRKPLFQNYMNKYIESHNRATVLSTIAMLYSLTAAVLNLIWGRMVDWNLQITLITIGAIIIIFTLISKIEEKHLLD